jgi:hypothetical protein
MSEAETLIAAYGVFFALLLTLSARVGMRYRRAAKAIKKDS